MHITKTNSHSQTRFGSAQVNPNIYTRANNKITNDVGHLLEHIYVLRLYMYVNAKHVYKPGLDSGVIFLLVQL